MLYAHAVGLTEGTIDEATIDAIAAAWGADATLEPGTDGDNLTDSAGYSYDMGFHATIAEALIAAKAHAADENCTAERDEALRTVFATWEQALFARMVYYGYETSLVFTTAASDDDWATGLHELGEGIGLATGLYGLPDPGSGPLSDGARVSTDADIEAIMTAYGVNLGDLGASTTGLWVEDVGGYDAGRIAAEQVVMDVFGLTAADIADYQTPTPG
jgi:hypothetical protein